MREGAMERRERERRRVGLKPTIGVVVEGEYGGCLSKDCLETGSKKGCSTRTSEVTKVWSKEARKKRKTVQRA
jgi:hypothetical protein